MDSKLLNILVCPVSKASLELSKNKKWLICRASGLAYPIVDNIPVLIVDQARELTIDEQLD